MNELLVRLMLILSIPRRQRLLVPMQRILVGFRDAQACRHRDFARGVRGGKAVSPRVPPLEGGTIGG